MNASVCNEKNWIDTTSMDRLSAIPAIPEGPRHNPVNHGNMLERFTAKSDDYGLKITAEKGMLSPDGKRYMYVADVDYNKLESDFAFTIGFVNFNDRSKSFTGLAGQRVFVCSNLCVTGIIDESRTRHSTNVEGRIDSKIDTIFKNAEQMFKLQMSNVDHMKAKELTDNLLGQFLLNTTRSGFMGAANTRRIIKEVDTPTLNNINDNSLWRLHNAATYVLRENVRNPLQMAESSKIINDEVMKLAI